MNTMYFFFLIYYVFAWSDEQDNQMRFDSIQIGNYARYIAK